MLSFKLKKQISKNVADTTFKCLKLNYIKDKHLKILNLCPQELSQVHYSEFKVSYIDTLFRKVFSKTILPTCFIRTSIMRIDTDMSFTFIREGIVVVGVVERAL